MRSTRTLLFQLTCANTAAQRPNDHVQNLERPLDRQWSITGELSKLADALGFALER